MKRLVVGALALGVAQGIATREAAAEERQFDLTGPSIEFGALCARTVVLTPTAALPAGHVHIVASSDRSEDLARLGSHSGQGIVFAATQDCPDGDTDRRHLHIEAQLPADMPIRIAGSGSETFRLGAFSGPLTIASHGSTAVSAMAVKSLTVDGSGSGDVNVDRVFGPVDLKLHGSGGVSIGVLDAPRLDAHFFGSGELILGQAHVGQASTTFDGSGDLKVRDAQIEKLSIETRGSGEVKVQSGRIGEANLRSHGSGDFSIGAQIGALRLDAHGSGDVDLPHVTNRLSVQADESESVHIGQ